MALHAFFHPFIFLLIYSLNKRHWSLPPSWALHVPRDKTYPFRRGGHSVVETGTQKQTNIFQSCGFSNKTRRGIERDKEFPVLSGQLPGLGQVA